MKVRYTSEFVKKLKTLDTRIRKAFKKNILLFTENPLNKLLDNHTLHDKWEGYRSVRVGDPKNDWRAIYEELDEGDEYIARFVAIGTHKELFN